MINKGTETLTKNKIAHNQYIYFWTAIYLFFLVQSFNAVIIK